VGFRDQLHVGKADFDAVNWDGKVWACPRLLFANTMVVPFAIEAREIRALSDGRDCFEKTSPMYMRHIH
jgi:hypothetical protein